MTTLIRRNEMFPAIFGWGAMDRILDEIERSHSDMFDSKHGYPSDILEIRDDTGKVIGYEIDVTLAGIPRENINISVERDAIVIIVSKNEKKDDKNRIYLQKGISQRSMEWRYGLHGIDKEKIKATLADGMLKVALPLAEEAKPKNIVIG